MNNQYDDFARDYEWIYSDFVQAGERHFRTIESTLRQLPPDPRILDCACGTGVGALALARHGCRVTGTDASEGMIARAKQHAAEEGVDVPFLTCSWEKLPDLFSEQFDLALCCGNSIGHCRDQDDMVRSLRGICGVIKPGGLLILDTRNWEKLLADRVRFTNFGPRQRDGKRCIPVYVWTFPQRPGDPVLVEVVLPIEHEGKVSLSTYPITYYPFRVEELLDRMKCASFVDVETDYSPDKASYQVTARKKS